MFIINEATPRVIIISLKNDTAVTISGLCCAGFRASIQPKKMNNKKEILHITANLEKKEITFINSYSLEIIITK